MSPRPATLPVLWPSAPSATKPDSRAPREAGISTASGPEREPPQNLLATVLRVL